MRATFGACVSSPAYTRLDVDERRRQLLDVSAEIFTERRYEDVSMSEIAARVGISKGLLYHYFSSKEELFRATLETAVRDLAERIVPNPDLPPAERVSASLDAFIDWIGVHEASYIRLVEDGGSVATVRERLHRVRQQSAELIASEVVAGPPPPVLVTAALGWLGYVNATCIDWLRHRHMTREQLRDMLVEVLFRSLVAATRVEPSIQLKLD
jgi:AcrR family transcriptional regulator